MHDSVLSKKKKLLLSLGSFLIPILIWSCVSYLPFIWHPQVQITDSGSVSYLQVGTRIEKTAFYREAQQAVDAAAAALPAWRALTAAQRATLLKNWHRLILENKTALAQIMTAEQGKPLAEAEGEIAYAASFIEWFAEQGKRANGEIIPSPGADKRLMVIRQGVGVCAAITPWNFPAAMITRKAGPALAAG